MGRYLAESGCAGMCVNLCKTPTQVQRQSSLHFARPGLRTVGFMLTLLMLRLPACTWQTFFTEQLGMPLTMEPDFETYECTMSFGKRPLPVAEDEVARQPCLAGCASALGSSSASQPCHKLQ